MKRPTKTAYDAIQQHIHRNYKRWFKRYSYLEGVHIGPKKVKGKLYPDQYSIVFHVFKKFKSPAKAVPKYILVKISRKRIVVPTDVIHTGKLELNRIKLGDTTSNANVGDLGTIGFYFTSPRGTYLCSNMHVLAPNFMNNNQIVYDVRRGDTPQSINLNDNTISANASLMVARFDGIDIGFARVENPNLVERIIKSVGPAQGVFSLNFSNSTTERLQYFGITSGLTSCNLMDLGAVRKTQFSNIFLTNLIKLQRCTEDGDSGAPLFDQRNRIVGIIVGRDREGSYALHIDDVIRFFQSSRL